MSIETIDPTPYYPSYVRRNPELTLEQYGLIQASWSQIKAGQCEPFKAQEVAANPVGFWGLLLYETLFELDPDLKPLFQNKFRQGEMLTEIVDSALGLLPSLLDQALDADQAKTEFNADMIPVLVNLAERHVSYRVKAKDYETVGLAIITALNKALGSRFDEQTKAAWVEFWSLICGVMIPVHVKTAQAAGVEI